MVGAGEAGEETPPMAVAKLDKDGNKCLPITNFCMAQLA